MAYLKMQINANGDFNYNLAVINSPNPYFCKGLGKSDAITTIEYITRRIQVKICSKELSVMLVILYLCSSRLPCVAIECLKCD